MSDLRRRFEVQGNAAAMFRCKDPAVLAESGAGTGKTFSYLIRADYTAWTFAGCRQLFVRRTRVSMNTAPLPEWEKDILWPGHPALARGASHYKDRVFYEYPNKSIIWLVGFDSQEKIDDVLSSKWDKIWIFQAEQMRLEDIEKLDTRLRNFGCALRENGYGGDEMGELILQEDGETPVDSGHQMFLDVNPAPPGHWIAKRFGLVRGTGRWKPPEGMSVFSYRHEDNPAYYVIDDEGNAKITAKGKDYVSRTLERLTGVRRERLLKHRWVSAEGMVWEEFDPEVHTIPGTVTMKPDGRGTLTVRGWNRPVELHWFMGSFDWGWEDPACFQCWGIDNAGRAYMVAEIYRQHWTQDDWAERIGEIHREFPMRTIVCDHEPSFIETMRRWLSKFYAGRDVGGIVQEADKLRDHGEKSGIDIVRQRMRPRADGTRGIYFLETALRHGPDPELLARSQPICTTDEIQGYAYRLREDGKPYKEEPDPLCPDHGADALRYFAKWAWGKDLGTADPEPGLVATDPIEQQYELEHNRRMERMGRPRPKARKW